MNYFCGIFLVISVLFSVVCGTVDNETDVLVRHKRGAVDLCVIMNKYTGRNCLDYNTYGCFCGLRSWGNNPKDSTDRCCRQHDQCLSKIPSVIPLYLIPFSYTCSGSSCRCTDKDRNSNKYRSCTCDVLFGQCLRSASYNVKYKYTSQKECI